jgi:hypothetical protein
MESGTTQSHTLAIKTAQKQQNIAKRNQSGNAPFTTTTTYNTDRSLYEVICSSVEIVVEEHGLEQF